MFFKVGALKPGQSTTFTFDTWMAPATIKVDEKRVAKVSKKKKTGKKITKKYKKVGGAKECKALCKKKAGCHVAKFDHLNGTCCLSSIDTKKRCPGKWGAYAGWTGYAVCKKK